ncbi:rolling circle replication-associated protein [Flavonifractor hominis]|uniref:Replication-associated protein ORF2/G2P domain-containing protein n=1 Tax=Flavonifractor hominis TaxID=3133178 RepID=A0ABV1ELQ9_9FIRM
MAKRVKTVTAGQLVIVGCYTIPTPRSSERERRALREISSAAQERMNLKRSWQKLELELAANFTRRDLHLVFTYDDEHLPATRPEAVKRLKKLIRLLRMHRKARGQEMKYIYVTEQLSAEGGRLHHHMILNGTGADLEVIRSLWPYGEVELEPLDLWQGYEALAKYLTKEPRECGKPEIGARTWAASIGLKKPKVESEIVKDNLTVVPPPGAIILSSPPPVENEFGVFTTIKYYLPVRKERKGTRPPRKRQRNSPRVFIRSGNQV